MLPECLTVSYLQGLHQWRYWGRRESCSPLHCRRLKGLNFSAGLWCDAHGCGPRALCRALENKNRKKNNEMVAGDEFHKWQIRIMDINYNLNSRYSLSAATCKIECQAVEGGQISKVKSIIFSKKYDGKTLTSYLLGRLMLTKPDRVWTYESCFSLSPLLLVHTFLFTLPG